MEDLLDLVQQRLTPLHVGLARLALEEILDVRHHAGGIDAALADVRLEPRGRIAAGARDADDDILQLLLAPGGGHGRALHGPELRADTDVEQIPGQRLAHREVRRPRIEVARVEAVRIAGLGEEFLGLRGIERIGLEEPRELERARDEGAGRLAEAERLGLVERLTVDGVAHGLTHAQVVPRRLRIPLVGQVEPEGSLRLLRRDELEAGGPADVLGHGTGEQIRDVHLAFLQRGRARGLFGQAAVDEALDVGHLAPVALPRLHHQLDAGIEAHELVRPGADRRLLEAVVTDLFDVGLGHDPAGAGGRGAVERHEVRPRLLQHEAHAPGIDDLHLAHAVLEEPEARALVALERELDVGRRHRLAVVELHALPDDELIGEAVFGRRPRLGQARGVDPGRHRLHQRVVQRVENHERRDDAFRLGGIEPAGCERDVHAPRHGAFGCRGRRTRAAEERDGCEHQDDTSGGSSHVHPPSRDGEYTARCRGYRRPAPTSRAAGKRRRNACGRRPRAS